LFHTVTANNDLRIIVYTYADTAASVSDGIYFLNACTAVGIILDEEQKSSQPLRLHLITVVHSFLHCIRFDLFTFAIGVIAGRVG